MAQTSVHICPVKGGSELHNERKKALDYVRPELTQKNEKWKSRDFPGIDEQQRIIRLDYATAHGKHLHAKATPIREAVVVITEDTTMQQLLAACAKCKEKFGIEAMQIYTHKDEGHTAEDGRWKPNLHAHIVFNWYDFQTHTTCKLSRQDMADMQTIFADSLAMERGVSSDRKHLTAIQQKNEAETAKFQRLQQQVQQQTTATKKELQNEIKALRRSGKNMVDAFDYLYNFQAVTPTDNEMQYRNALAMELSHAVPADLPTLEQHAAALRINLMNTINSVHRIGHDIQRLASNIPKFTLLPWRKSKLLQHEQQVLDERKKMQETINDLKYQIEMKEMRWSTQEEKYKCDINDMRNEVRRSYQNGANDAYRKCYTAYQKPSEFEQFMKFIASNLFKRSAPSGNTTPTPQRNSSYARYEEEQAEQEAQTARELAEMKARRLH